MTTTNETEATTVQPLTTSDLAQARGISTTAVRQGARRDPRGAPSPDESSLGRGRPWTWNPTREDVKVYLMTPVQLAAVAVGIRDRAGSISAGARAVGVDRQTFVRVLRGQEWSQYATQLKVWEVARRD
jgi:hypothetical protein